MTRASWACKNTSRLIPLARAWIAKTSLIAYCSREPSLRRQCSMQDDSREPSLRKPRSCDMARASSAWLEHFNTSGSCELCFSRSLVIKICLHHKLCGYPFNGRPPYILHFEILKHQSPYPPSNTYSVSTLPPFHLMSKSLSSESHHQSTSISHLQAKALKLQHGMCRAQGREIVKASGEACGIAVGRCTSVDHPAHSSEEGWPGLQILEHPWIFRRVDHLPSCCLGSGILRWMCEIQYHICQTFKILHVRKSRLYICFTHGHRGY